MPGPSFVAIVASLHGQVGKTLLARTLTDYFVLSGGKPYIFDTDPVERGLHALFPAEARSHGIELAIFYIPDRRADSFEAGVILRDNFRDCAFIVVDNAFLKESKRSARQGASYKALRAH